MAKSRWTGKDTRAESGFSIVEALVATTIMVVGVASLAQLFVISTKANSSGKVTTMATVLAEHKMEQLRSLQWGFDTLGLPLTDTTTNTAVSPESATGGTGLSPSTSNTLAANTVGYVDYLDASGNLLTSTSTTPPANTAYIRRWSVESLPTNPNNTLVLQVLVTRSRNRGTADMASGVGRLPDEARLVSAKTRKAK